jgi:hypothetical protein
VVRTDAGVAATRRVRVRLLLVGVVVLTGLLATVLGSYVAVKAKGVYWSRVQVRFIAPTSEDYPNGLQISPSSTVMTAGAVRRIVDDSDKPRTVSQDVILSGLGIRNGWSVNLPNTGGQWANNFTNPYLDVQAVGPTADGVEATISRVILDINAALAKLQTQAAVADANLIHTQLSPPGNPPLYFQRGSRIRAGLAALGLGLGITWFVTAATVRWSRRRRSRPEPMIGPDSARELALV